MNNVVSVAINAGKSCCGTTEETEWYVTFVTNDVKRGKIRQVAEGVFLLAYRHHLFYFHEEQVVHISPHVTRKLSGG
jgi:hypothetical protein